MVMASGGGFWLLVMAFGDGDGVAYRHAWYAAHNRLQAIDLQPISHQPSAISHQPPAISHQPSAISHHTTRTHNPPKTTTPPNLCACGGAGLLGEEVEEAVEGGTPPEVLGECVHSFTGKRRCLACVCVGCVCDCVYCVVVVVLGVKWGMWRVFIVGVGG